MSEPAVPQAKPQAWQVTAWCCWIHPGERWVRMPAGIEAWVDESQGVEVTHVYTSLDAVRAHGHVLMAAAVDNVTALWVDERRYRELWHASVRADRLRPRDAVKDAAESAMLGTFRDLIRRAEDDRDAALARVGKLENEQTRLLLVMAFEGAGIDPAGNYPGTPGYRLRDLYAERDAARDAVARVRELHKPFTKGVSGDQWCEACSPPNGVGRYLLVAWPCPTVAALDATPVGSEPPCEKTLRETGKPDSPPTA